MFRFIGLIFRTLWRMRWALPLVMMAVGYYLVPVSHAPVTGMPKTQELWEFFYFSTAIGGAWALAEIIVSIWRYTTTTHLQVDDFLSLLVMGVVLYVAGWQQWPMPWWVVVPMGTATFDGLLSGFLGINNAAQKTFGPEQSRPPRE